MSQIVMWAETLGWDSSASCGLDVMVLPLRLRQRDSLACLFKSGIIEEFLPGMLLDLRDVSG